MQHKLFITCVLLLLSLGLKAQNSVTVVNPQTTVQAGNLITYNVNYTKTIAGSAYVLVRFKDSNGNNLKFAVETVTANSATIPLTVEAPATAGSNYSIQAQLLEMDWSGLSTYNLAGITVTPLTNSITVVNPQTTVQAGDLITYNVNYTKIITGSAYVLVRFKDSNGNNLKFAVETVTANSATIPLTVEAPATAGSNYSIQAQLLEMDWSGLSTYNLAGITVTPLTNSITVVNPQTTVQAGDLITYDVHYTKTIAGSAYVLVRFKDPNGNNLKFAVETVTANSATIPLTVEAPAIAGSNYSLQAQLLKMDWSGLKTYNLNGGITVSSNGIGGNNGDVNNLDQIVHYTPGENNDFHKQNLGKGYWTNWFIDASWLGTMSAKFGPAETSSWIDFDNQGGHNGHGEIDIKIQKASWDEDKDKSVDRGYPSKINDVSSNLACEIEGRWSSNSRGRAFINMTAWITKDKNSWVDRCDVIVHTWDNSGALHNKYAYKEANSPSEGYRVLNSFTSNGVSYHVLKKGGGNGEVATFNLVPKVNLRFGTNPAHVVTAAEWQGDFETTASSYTVNMEDILRKLIISENTSNKNPVGITDQWYIQVLEWTVVPSGQDVVDGVTIGNAKGRYNILNYKIPNLIGLPYKSGETAPNIEQDLPSKEVLSVYPNPFKNSFTYTYKGEKQEMASAELYSMDGKKVYVGTSHNKHDNSITVDTHNLSPGIYILHIYGEEEVITKKLVKN